MLGGGLQGVIGVANGIRTHLWMGIGAMPSAAESA